MTGKINTLPHLELSPEHDQEPHPTSPYDRWVTPDGGVAAEFYRLPDGFLIRFPGQADFQLDAVAQTVRGCAVPNAPPGIAEDLFHNAIMALIGNFRGELNLHGSAVDLGERAVAFVGRSRSGKTTLAAAFARAGYPFLSEDVIALHANGPGSYLVKPARPVLRLFPDSASFIFGAEGNGQPSNMGRKAALPAGPSVPFAERAVPLAGLVLLGEDTREQPSLERLAPASALAAFMQHAFVLDVEDKARMSAHFERMGDLACSVTCYCLNYPRIYDQIPAVISLILKKLGR